jgi:hypothetical protein
MPSVLGETHVIQWRWAPGRSEDGTYGWHDWDRDVRQSRVKAEERIVNLSRLHIDRWWRAIPEIEAESGLDSKGSAIAYGAFGLRRREPTELYELKIDASGPISITLPGGYELTEGEMATLYRDGSVEAGGQVITVIGSVPYMETPCS